MKKDVILASTFAIIIKTKIWLSSILLVFIKTIYKYMSLFKIEKLQSLQKIHTHNYCNTKLLTFSKSLGFRVA